MLIMTAIRNDSLSLMETAIYFLATLPLVLRHLQVERQHGMIKPEIIEIENRKK